MEIPTWQSRALVGVQSELEVCV